MFGGYLAIGCLVWVWAWVWAKLAGAIAEKHGILHRILPAKIQTAWLRFVPSPTDFPGENC